jgi:superfamily I DNA/RNA helicase
MALALPLLDRIAPGVEPPLAYRQGGTPPKLVRVAEEELMTMAAHEAAAFDEGLLAVIGPRSLVEDGVIDETYVLTPPQAKGLEFDHVVVVEPARIVEEGGERGLRELYVALTRPTKTLVVVYSREGEGFRMTTGPLASGPEGHPGRGRGGARV